MIYRKSFICYWAAALASCFLVSSIIIFVTVNRFFENPTYVVIRDTSNASTRFPSVVVCPEIVYQDYKIDEFLSNLYPEGTFVDDFKPIIQQLAAYYAPDVDFIIEDLIKIEALLQYNKIDAEFAGKKLTTTCEEALLRCRLFGVVKNCTNLFRMELSPFGFCCVFNGRSFNREMRERGFSSANPPLLYTTDLGFESGLVVVVNNSQSLADVDITYKWVYLERGQQYTEIGKSGTAIFPQYELWMGYISQDYLIDQQVRSLSPEISRCQMSTTKLKHFPFYAKRYCIKECEMRLTMQRCLCVEMSDPRSWYMKTCDARKLRCMRNSAVKDSSSACDCPPTCDSVNDYTVHRDFRMIPANYIIDPLYNDLNFSQVTVVRAFVAHHDIHRRVRQSYYSAINLFSQIGGSLNLVFGWSILTLVELIQLIGYGYRQYKTVLQTRQKKGKEKQPAVSKKYSKAEPKILLRSIGRRGK